MKRKLILLTISMLLLSLCSVNVQAASPNLYLYLNGSNSTLHIEIDSGVNLTEYIDLQSDNLQAAEIDVNFTTGVNYSDGYEGYNHIFSGLLFNIDNAQNDTGDGTGSVEASSGEIGCVSADGQLAIFNFTTPTPIWL